MLTVLILCIVGYLADCGLNEEARALRFPEELSLNNYVKLTSAIKKPLTAVSVCSWMKKSLDPRVQHYWFSYAVEGRYNELALSDRRHLFIGNKEPLDFTDSILLKNEWYHLCLTWDAGSSIMSFYVNGVLVKSKSISSTSIGSGGILILGQEQDSYGGSFDINQAFGGDLFQLNVFSRRLVVEDVAAMYYDGRCSEVASSLVHSIVISWKDILDAPRNGDVHEVSAECGGRSDRSFLDKVTKLILQEL